MLRECHSNKERGANPPLSDEARGNSHSRILRPTILSEIPYQFRVDARNNNYQNESALNKYAGVYDGEGAKRAYIIQR